MSKTFREIFRDYNEISVRYDIKQEAIWCYFNPQERPCFSPILLKESIELQQSIIRYFKTDQKREKYPVRYMVLASQKPGVFSFGGDLNLFVRLISEQKREQMLEYARSCIDICYMNAVGLHLPLTTISFVEGSALGGGFESALSGNILIAEKHVQLGVPEIRFNLFPGMGAYSFLARKAGTNIAEKILRSGEIYNARELYDMGVVDILAESGKGRESVNQYIKKHSRVANGLQAIQEVKQYCNPITYDELIGITKIWVEAALRLTKKDLRIMEKIVTAQNRGNFDSDIGNTKLKIVRTTQDRRIDSRNVSYPLVDSSGEEIFVDRRSIHRRDSRALLDRRRTDRRDSTDLPLFN